MFWKSVRVFKSPGCIQNALFSRLFADSHVFSQETCGVVVNATLASVALRRTSGEEMFHFFKKKSVSQNRQVWEKQRHHLHKKIDPSILKAQFARSLVFLTHPSVSKPHHAPGQFSAGLTDQFNGHKITKKLKQSLFTWTRVNNCVGDRNVFFNSQAKQLYWNC